MQFNTNMKAADFDKAFKIYAILITLSVTVFTVSVYVPQFGSLQDSITQEKILNPNAVAMVCMSGFISAFAFQNFVLKMLLVGIHATIIVMMASRGSALGVVSAVVVFLWYRRKEWQIRHVIISWMVMLYLFAVVFIWWEPLMGPVKTFFDLSDQTIATGANRFVLWQGAWELFLSNPLFGVGYRAHEALMPGQASAHNGYLAILAEIGIIGSVALVYPIWKGIKFLRIKNTFEPAVSYAVLIAIGIAYLYVALFERYLINFGNPTSIVFLIAIFSYLIPYGERTTWRSAPKIGLHLKL